VLAGRRAAGDTVTFCRRITVSDDAVFMGQVEQAFDGCAGRPDLVTLLGIAPDRAEPGYGWIEPGDPVAGAEASGLREVRGFSEKPAPGDAERFRAQGWLWNSFVMVGRVSTLLALIGSRSRISTARSPR
jgi:mannose-1-phosphate guanylyltransferase